MAACYSLSEKQYAAVTHLKGIERYKHFLSRVADWEKVWGLRNESGWVAASDDAGNSGFPVWPHPQYATACATGVWSGNIPVEINVQEFIETWLPNLASENVQVAVFPTLNLKGIMVHALQLQDDLLRELSQYD